MGIQGAVQLYSCTSEDEDPASHLGQQSLYVRPHREGGLQTVKIRAASASLNVEISTESVKLEFKMETVRALHKRLQFYLIKLPVRWKENNGRKTMWGWGSLFSWSYCK